MYLLVSKILIDIDLIGLIINVYTDIKKDVIPIVTIIIITVDSFYNQV